MNDHQLPPGQKLLDHFPRFGLWQYATRLKEIPDTLEISLRYGNYSPITLDASAFDALPRIEQTSDFHCVGTWSVLSQRWSGYRFKDFYERIVLTAAKSGIGAETDLDKVIFTCCDTYQAHMRLDDLLADDVILADRLNDRPLGFDHGGPLRLVAPAHYGFKSAKHVCAIQFSDSLSSYKTPAFHWHEHPRARVAFEERGRFLPTWFWRNMVGRFGISSVFYWYRRAAEKRTNKQS